MSSNVLMSCMHCTFESWVVVENVLHTTRFFLYLQTYEATAYRLALLHNMLCRNNAHKNFVKTCGSQLGQYYPSVVGITNCIAVLQTALVVIVTLSNKLHWVQI